MSLIATPWIFERRRAFGVFVSIAGVILGCRGPTKPATTTAKTAPSTTAPSSTAAPSESKPKLESAACSEGFAASDFDEQHAEDLEAVATKGLTTKHAARTWSSQMQGKPEPDLLGRKLPPFATRERVLTWTAHPDRSEVTIVGVRPWRPKEHLWIAVAAGKDARLAVIEVSNEAADSPVRVVARTARSLVPNAQWRYLPEDYRPMSANDGEPADGEVSALDLAEYRLSKDELAFGVRFNVNEGYAGGGASFESLALMRVHGDTIVPVLQVPMAAFKMIAGDWNPDETRQHDTFAAELQLEVGKEDAGGLRALSLHPSGSSRSLWFRWDSAAQSYACE